MTSIGYGDVLPSTKIGRGLACTCALWGGFMMSLVVAVISNALFLSEKDKEVVDIYREEKLAAELIISGFKYNNILNKRIRALNTKDPKAKELGPSLKLKQKFQKDLWASMESYHSFRTGESTAKGS